MPIELVEGYNRKGEGDIMMQLEGIGRSATSTIPSINLTSEVGIDENKVNNQEKKVQSQEINKEAKGLEEKKYSQDEVIDIIEAANAEFVLYDRRFEFSIHEKTKQIMVKVLDSTTDEVIKELPPEKVLDIVAGLLEVAGIIIDKKI